MTGSAKRGDAVPLRLPRSVYFVRPSTSLVGQLSSFSSSLVDDQPLEFLALCGVFLGCFSSLSGLLAAGGVLVFAVLLWGRGWQGARWLLRWSPLLAYPLLLVASTIWSPDPWVTARYSAQLLLTALIGLYVGVFRTPLDGLRIFFVTSATLIIVSIISGKQGESAEGAVLIGVLGSKDALAITAQAVAQTGLALALTRGPWFWRVAGVIMVPVSAYLVVQSNAATGVITLSLGLAMALALRAGSYFPRSWKGVLALAVLVILAVLFLMRAEVMDAAQTFSLHVLHKDPTLTGRTILWDYAREFIHQRPWLGWGYKEAWLGSSVNTMGLLRWAGILDGRTFYFHQTWLEATVDSGYIGATVLGLTWLVSAGFLIWAYLRSRTSPTLEFSLVIIVLIAFRSLAETIMQPFFIQVALLSMVGVYGLRSFLKEL